MNEINDVVSSTNNNSIGGLIVLIVILFLFIIFCLYMTIKTSKIKKQNKENLKKLMKNKSATLQIVIPHLMGLSLPENTICAIYSCKDKYEIIANGISYFLDKSKVTDVSMKTDVEIQKQAISSIGGAVGGAVLLGPLGAMIGGRTKTKNIKTITTCLIFTYIKDNKTDFIAFNATNNFKAIDFVKEFNLNKNLSTTTSIEL